MTNLPNSCIVGFDVERSASVPTSATFTTVGSALTVNPTVIIFDNQSSVTASISVDGTNSWKTFVSGEVFVLDLVTNGGNFAAFYTIPIGTQFYVNGTSGATGAFKISIIYKV